MNSLAVRDNKKKLSIIMIIGMLVLTLFSALPADTASANSNKEAWEKAGITEGKSIKNSDVYADLKNIVYFIMVVGGIWVIFWLIIGGMMLSGSNGNPQRRIAGISSLVTSAAGGYVIYKAYDIAGYIAGFGA